MVRRKEYPSARVTLAASIDASSPTAFRPPADPSLSGLPLDTKQG
jgi:hypothetical protein